MRLGLALGENIDLATARRADELGFWALLARGDPGAEMVRAARLVAATRDLRVIVEVDLQAEHPMTIAEEITVLDNLSGGRIMVLAKENALPSTLYQLREALIGRPLDGVMLAPPPAQTEVPVWVSTLEQATELALLAPSLDALVIRPGAASPGIVSLSGDIQTDQQIVDAWRDAGCTHLLVSWPGSVKILARHLASRVATVAFPTIVADIADRIDPIAPEN